MRSEFREFEVQIDEFGKVFLQAYDDTNQISEMNKNIIICGMGGSSITGNYISTLANHFQSKTQVVVCKEYDLPSFVTKEWFALAISYSGNTEETISMTKQLLQRGIETQIMTSGGELMKIAKEEKIHLHKLVEGFQPRFAFPMILGKAMKLFTNVLRFNPISSSQREEIENFSNVENKQSLKNMVKSCSSKKIIILSDNSLSSVALRFRCQLNENSKLTAQNHILPEFNHNGIVGVELINKNAYLVFSIINEICEHERTKIQRKFTENYFQEKGVELIRMNTSYQDFSVHILAITRDLDMLSFLIAQSMGTNPVKVDSISQLKSKLQGN